MSPPFLALLAIAFVLKLASSFIPIAHFDRSKHPHSNTLLQAETYDEQDEGALVQFAFTGIEKNVVWKFDASPVSAKSEILLQESKVLVKRGEFGKLSEKRTAEVRERCEQVGMSLEQGRSVRKQLLVNKVMKSSYILRDKTHVDSMSHKFDVGKSILRISHEYDLPPVSIMRAILKSRVHEAHPKWREGDRKDLVKAIISGEEQSQHAIISEIEREELRKAKLADTVGYTHPVKEMDAASKWEKALYQFLDRQNIKYVTEETMREAGATTTPDCLLLDNCIINGHLVRWIDSKNFYGSASNQHYTKKVIKQVTKYDAKFGGSGAIIYRHSFSTKLTELLPTALLLDQGPLII